MELEQGHGGYSPFLAKDPELGCAARLHDGVQRSNASRPGGWMQNLVQSHPQWETQGHVEADTVRVADAHVPQAHQQEDWFGERTGWEQLSELAF